MTQSTEEPLGRRVAHTIHLGKDDEGYFISIVERDTGNYNSFNVSEEQVVLLCKLSFDAAIATGRGHQL